MLSISKTFSRPKGWLGSIAGLIMANENKALNQWAIRHLDLTDGENILEIGYGPGYSIKHMLKHYQGLHIDGLDASSTMQEQAQSRVSKRAKDKQVRLYVGKIEKTRLPGEQYDKVLSVNNFTIWDDPKTGLLNLYHTLKPGGTLAIVMQPREKGADANRTKEMGENILNDLQFAGFDEFSIEYEEIRPTLAVCVTAKKPRSE
ncbi:class I SAM-dependent methyltransferase [Bacillus safensis]|uniref:class I SAM-dependent methyltransferase n=1 Tax=Bacillus TaxID=1386 RepID=UPI0015A32EE8|nr:MULTISPECIES: class I SAM-dependent methyltransferase [Bacillus]MBY0189685.1 class I SAM-dependent methyltransferase [Bacillus aerophilus]MEC1118075.1 class I SAM-dependent methyltransferase [Bacillus safensis]MED1518804.1 class I SAM-dependent methyltransferase [Bacillus safensis]NWF42429.1 SAM-dependent methyltransferase [Bacillus sp. 8A6]GLF84280.1 putative methyltransferase YdaC [Bacillus safensis]